jgi:hypothetical protein
VIQRDVEGKPKIIGRTISPDQSLLKGFCEKYGVKPKGAK